MLSMDHPEQFLEAFTAWAEQNAGVLGAAVVGSHARGTARPDSDLDLVLLCQEPGLLLDDDSWLRTWGETTSTQVEDYGALTSLRAFYAGGPEVEFGLTTPDWAAMPVDAGTREVVRGGMRVLYDPNRLLEKLQDAVTIQSLERSAMQQKRSEATPAGIEVHPVTPDRWDDMVALFNTSPVMSSCWCMSPRTRAKDFGRFGAEARRRNREAMHNLVVSGTVPGLLAYAEGRPVGWISVGPREGFARLQHSPTLRPVDDLPVWSIVCFYTDPDYRQQGITRVLIQAAVRYAAAHGAPAVEAYPIATWGERVGPGDAYTGIAGTFRALGFEEVQSDAGRSRGQPRLIMRYDLG